MNATDFKPGMRVKYIPRVANKNPNHEACEEGIVSSTNDSFVFVRYENGINSFAQKGCPTDPEDLIIINKK